MNKDEILAVLQPYIRFADSVNDTENVSAYCPFHKNGQEKTPSFYVYVGEPTERGGPGSSFCHTCNEGWSLPGLLKKLRVGRRVIDSVKHLTFLAKKSSTKALPAVGESLQVLPETLLGLFSYAPKQLIRDGFNKQLLKEYDIGFDRERRRITFPIRDHKGNLVGVSGRTVVDEYPRYKIYKSEFSELVSNYSFNKRHVLWGLHKFYKTRMSTPTDMPVIICEGFKAALWVIQTGYTDVIALIGAFISNEQKLLLSRVANEVVLFLDNDDAGRKATMRALTTLSGLSIRVADYRTNEPLSPDDLTETQVRIAVELAQDSSNCEDLLCSKTHPSSIDTGRPEPVVQILLSVGYRTTR
jgi:DNA primase